MITAAVPITWPEHKFALATHKLGRMALLDGTFRSQPLLVIVAIAVKKFRQQYTIAMVFFVRKIHYTKKLPELPAPKNLSSNL